MSERIKATFAQLAGQGRKALVPYVTAGFPWPDITVPLMHDMVEAGADLIELGVPFSDPMADGPTIQRANDKALAAGISMAKVLDIVREFRRENGRTPVVLMGYANPIEAMGQGVFFEAARSAGVDGVIVVDYPPEEAREFSAAARACGLSEIFLLAPTSDAARVDAVLEQAGGFIYYVSLRGVTGAAHLDVEEVGRQLHALRMRTELPIGVGFGIRDAATAVAIGRMADAVVIGSKVIEVLEPATTPEQARAELRAFLAGIRAALDAAADRGRAAR
ncbi:MAG: tryptophan synthase subunit alpha [Burkholderiaceae bacterium]